MNSGIVRSVLAKAEVLQAAIVTLLAFISLAQGAELPFGDQRRSVNARDMSSVAHVVVVLNKSTTVRIPGPFNKVIIASSEIADVLPATAYTLYIQGKKIGTTN